jgi:hypothetical protein
MELHLYLGNKLGRPAGETLEITIGRVVGASLGNEPLGSFDGAALGVTFGRVVGVSLGLGDPIGASAFISGRHWC